MLRNKLVPLRGEPTIKTGGLLLILNGFPMRLMELSIFQTALLIPGASVLDECHFTYWFQYRRPEVVGAFCHILRYLQNSSFAIFVGCIQ
jgi:hypothetical protein